MASHRLRRQNTTISTLPVTRIGGQATSPPQNRPRSGSAGVRTSDGSVSNKDSPGEQARVDKPLPKLPPEDMAAFFPVDDRTLRLAQLNRPRKRVRKSNPSSTNQTGNLKAQARGIKKKGKLAFIIHMPLEILYEILSSLHPSDLLRMSRTNKTLRRMIMSRSMRPVWIASINTAGPALLPCPAHLTEPQYVQLYFENNCHFCLAHSVSSVVWPLWVRCCKSCSEREDSQSPLLAVDLGVVPGRDPLAIPMEKLVMEDLVPCAVGLRPGDSTRYNLRTDVKRTENELVRLANLGVDADIRKFKTDAVLRVAAQHAVAKNHEAQYRDVQRLQQLERDMARSQRMEDINSRLRDLGYGREIHWLGQLQVPRRRGLAKGSADTLTYRDWARQKFVNQTRPLTERVWANIRHDSETYMEAVRRKRTWQLWQTTVENRVGILSRLVQEHHATLPLNTILPGIGDLYTQDAFRAVLDCPLNEDDSDPVTADGFHPAMATLPTFAQQWRLAATEIVRNLLPPLEEATREVDEKLSAETLVHTPTPPDRLQLATSVFECVCSWRRCYRTYPNVLAHRCSNSFGGTSVDSDSDEDLGTEDIPAGFDLMAAPWSRDNLRKWFVKITGHVSFNGKNKLRFDHFTRGSLFLHARAIIFVRMAGLDPDTATQADMDASGARFICSCDNGTEECGGEQSVMDWRNLIIKHDGCATGGIQLAPTALAQEACDAEERVHGLSFTAQAGRAGDDATSSHPGYGSWTCAHCRAAGLTAYELVWHLSKQHAVVDALRDVNFILDHDQFADPWKADLVRAPS